MKTLALMLLLLTAPAAQAGRIVESSMGGDLEVRNAPDGASLRTMGGNIRVGTARGHVVAKTMGGDIDVEQLHGSLDAGTMGGNVEVDVAQGGGEIEISSLGGSIEIALPANFSGTFEIELEQDDEGRKNEIRSDFPLQIRRTKKKYWLRPDPEVLIGTGKIGTGTHHVKITTIGGDIRIRRK
jgi:DUF4097 and DUF4098 domain-containing protein YvlB